MGKLINFLKKYQEGAIIGAIVAYLLPTLIIINFTFGTATPQTKIFVSTILSLFIGALVGAWIQSKIKGN